MYRVKRCLVEVMVADRTIMKIDVKPVIDNIENLATAKIKCIEQFNNDDVYDFLVMDQQRIWFVIRKK